MKKVIHIWKTVALIAVLACTTAFNKIDGEAFSKGREFSDSLTESLTLPGMGLSVGIPRVWDPLRIDGKMIPRLEENSSLDPQSGTAKWTVMVYLDGDNNLEGFNLEKFITLGQVGSTNDVNLVAQMDRGEPSGVNEDIDDYGNWEDTRRFYITQGMEPYPNNGVSIGEANMGDDETLINFIEWSKTNYPADRYMLIMFDHGHGWNGTFGGLQDSTFFEDETNSDELDMWELRNALGVSTNDGSDPIEILGIDACLMGSIEVDSQLRPFAEYRISHQEFAWSSDWSYNQFLQNLVNNPLIETRDFAILIATENLEHSPLMKTESVIDLGTPYGNLISKVNDLATALIDLNGAYQEEIQDARINAQYLAVDDARPYRYVYVDLYDFANNIFSMGLPENHPLQLAASGVVNAMNSDLILFNHAAPNHWPNVHGITIYFPIVESYYNTLYNGSSNHLQFTGDTLWDEWLHEYFAHYDDLVPPTDFNKISPSNGASTDLHPWLTWTTSNRTIGYEYCYDTTDNDSCDTNDWVAIGPSPDAQLEGLAPGTTYHWQVRAVNGVTTVEADGGTWWSFTTAASPPVVVTISDLDGNPVSMVTVQAYNGTTYTGYSGVTDSQGRVIFTLPAGNYRFKTYRYSRSFFSGESNHCAVPGCTAAGITVDNVVVVTALDTGGNPEGGMNVQAYNGSTYTGFYAMSNAQGQAFLVLPAGSYHFRIVKNGTTFWSDGNNHCTVPGCTDASITTNSIPVVVTVQDLTGQPQAGITVQAYNGTTYTGYSGVTNAQGQVSLTLPVGSYRFRAYRYSRSFYSGAENHCAVPGCTAAGVTVDNLVIVTALDSNGNPVVGVNVQAYNGSTYTGYYAATDAQGRSNLVLPAGGYRFRYVKDGTTVWSNANNHCTVPGCSSASFTMYPVTVTVFNLDGNPEPGLTVYLFNGSTYLNYSQATDAAGQATFTVQPGSYRFRVNKYNREFWSGETNHCTTPGCSAVSVAIFNTVTVTVADTSGNPEPGLVVQAYDGATATAYSASTDALGHASVLLPAGNYRFRVLKNNRPFWSGESNHCAVPGCTDAAVTTTVPVAVTVTNLDGTPEPGLTVYLFDGTTYLSYSQVTNAAGQVTFTVPPSSYRFRVNKYNREFWSGETNHCTVPGCSAVNVTIFNTVTVTVADTSGNPDSGLTVQAYDGATATAYSASTDALGHASVLLPAGNYRFRVLKNNRPFWSGETNHCGVPGCAGASITTTVPIVVTVLNLSGNPEPGLTVYLFDGTTYLNYSRATDASGQAAFTVPQGSYRFRVNKNGQEFWSGPSNHCTVPGCTEVIVSIDTGVSTGFSIHKFSCSMRIGTERRFYLVM